MPRRISYAQLERILLDAGFRRVQTRGAHIRLIHEESGAHILLPPRRQVPAPDASVRAIARILDEYWIMPKEDFFDAILEKELGK